MTTNPTTGAISIHPSFNKARLLLVLLLSTLISTSFQSGQNEITTVEPDFAIIEIAGSLKAVFTRYDELHPAYLGEELVALPQSAKKFYSLNDFRPVWTSHTILNENGKQITDLIGHAQYFGLEPGNYHLERIQQICHQLETKTSRSEARKLRVELELLLTDGTLKFMVNLHSGYRPFDTALLHESWMENMPGILSQGIRANNLLNSVLSTQPTFVTYLRLQKATSIFVKTHHLTNDTLFTATPEADSELYYKQLGETLFSIGLADRNCSRKEAIAGLKEFQVHHGLEGDGKAGRNTRDALKMTMLYRYKMLALNLDRLRKQDNMADHLLYVNIPAYQLTVYRQNKIEDVYRVIVGNPETPTPQLNSKVLRIIANPVWDVPQSIAQKELLPKIQADSGYLRRNGFMLVDRNNKRVDPSTIDINRIRHAEYFIRQESSSDNALGKVKFIFPNPYSVYLHDTPGRTLFAKDTRDLSHGCVRLQDPEKLAEYLVHVIEGDSTDISGIIAGGTHREINFQTDIPIHISYITCNADEKGELYFYRDIYGLDEKEMAILAGAGI